MIICILYKQCFPYQQLTINGFHKLWKCAYCTNYDLLHTRNGWNLLTFMMHRRPSILERLWSYVTVECAKQTICEGSMFLKPDNTF